MSDNLNEAIKQAVPGGDAVPVLDEDGKVIGYCGLLAPREESYMGLFRVLAKEQENLKKSS